MEKKRVLALYRNSKMMKAYRIRLGFNPEGQKQKEGDGKLQRVSITSHKNPNSKFYLSLGINFPNKIDKKRALNKGFNPGSDIFIHGLGKKCASALHVRLDRRMHCSNEQGNKRNL